LLGQPLIGFLVTVYAIAGIAAAHEELLDLVAVVVIGSGCLAGLRNERLRHLALGGALALITFSVAAFALLMSR